MRASTMISSKACLFILKFGPSARQQGQTLQIRVIPRSVVSLLLLLLLGWGHRFFLLTYLGLSLGFPWITENKGKPRDNREWKKNLAPRAASECIYPTLQNSVRKSWHLKCQIFLEVSDFSFSSVRFFWQFRDVLQILYLKEGFQSR